MNGQEREKAKTKQSIPLLGRLMMVLVLVVWVFFLRQYIYAL